MGSMTGAWAGLSVYTTWPSLPPTTSANQRTIDFSTHTLASEKGLGKIDFTQSIGAASGCIFFICSGSEGGISQTSSSNLSGFSGNVLSLTSGTTSNSTSLTITFATPTPFVGFLWGVQFNAENSMQVNVTLEGGTVVTLNNCSNSSNNLCVAKYVSSNWFTNIYNALLGWLLGDSVTYYPIYMQYEPDGVVKKKITKVQFLVKNCAGCGFLSGNTSQDLKIDYITYVDASVKPHHLEVTTGAASTPVNAATNFTVKACGDAACTVPYTSGVSGSLTISGVSATSTTIPFTIDPGPTNTATVAATMTSVGDATIALTGLTPAPSNAPAVFCGMGVAAASGNNCKLTVTAAAPHHLELTTATDTTLSCQPVAFRIKACTDANCLTPYTAGVSGTLALGSSSTAFSIPASSSHVDLLIYPGGVGSVAASLGSLSVAPTNTAKPVYCGINAAASSSGACTIAVQSSGFVLTVPDHMAESAQNMKVQALSASSDPQVCTSAFGPGAVKAVTFKCSYTNPGSGSQPVRLGGLALNSAGNAAAACDGTGKAVTLTFTGTANDAAATVAFRYADAGQVQITASYVGGETEPGLNLGGSKSVIVSPASFGFSGVTAGPIKAGSTFGATVTARNALNVATPNFGKETPPAKVDLTFTRRLPSGAAGSGISDGVFSGTLGTFSNGAASSSNLSWTEVGTGDLVATLNGGNYLASSAASGTLVPTGTTALPGAAGQNGSVGPFIPDQFKVEATNACSTGFTFNDQPFTVKVQALNAAGHKTVNLGAGLSSSAIAVPVGGTSYILKPNITLAVASASPSPASPVFSNGEITAASFVAGEGSSSAVRYKFDKLTPPTTIGLSATASFGAVQVATPADKQGSVTLRSGRLKISNVFGSEKKDLEMLVQSQFWSAGKAWVINALDTDCTVLPAASVTLSGYRDHKGQATSAWTTTATPGTISGGPATPGALKNGTGKIVFSKPSPSATGSVDVALNLGDANLPDVSCLSTHGGTGAGMPWLRSQNGNCATTFDRDPSARVTFGIYKPESSRTIHVREIY
jgi:MSHA biogenesis protein MshQ